MSKRVLPTFASRAKWVAVVVSLATFAACSAGPDDSGSSNDELNLNLNTRDRMPIGTYLK